MVIVIYILLEDLIGVLEIIKVVVIIVTSNKVNLVVVITTDSKKVLRISKNGSNFNDCSKKVRVDSVIRYLILKKNDVDDLNNKMFVFVLLKMISD